MILRPGDRVTFTADVLWRLYQRSFYDKACLPVFRVLHVNSVRQSVLIKDANGIETALSLELLVPIDTSWDSCRRILRLAQSPEELVGFMRWHAEGCSMVEKPSSPATIPPARNRWDWRSRLRRALAVMGVLSLSIACPPLGMMAILAAWSRRDA